MTQFSQLGPLSKVWLQTNDYRQLDFNFRRLLLSTASSRRLGLSSTQCPDKQTPNLSALWIILAYIQCNNLMDQWKNNHKSGDALMTQLGFFLTTLNFEFEKLRFGTLSHANVICYNSNVDVMLYCTTLLIWLLPDFILLCMKGIITKIYLSWCLFLLLLIKFRFYKKATFVWPFQNVLTLNG